MKRFFIIVSLSILSIGMWAKAMMCPSWFYDGMSANEVIGISMPYRDGEVAKKHAVCNAIMNGIINNGLGQVQLRVEYMANSTQTGYSNVDGNSETTIVDMITLKGFTFDIRETYYNANDECFVRGVIEENAADSGNVVFIKRINIMQSKNQVNLHYVSLSMEYQLGTTRGSLHLEPNEDEFRVLIDGNELSVASIKPYKKYSLRPLAPKYTTWVSPSHEDVPLGLMQTSILASVPLAPTHFTYQGDDKVNMAVSQVLDEEDRILSKYQQAYHSVTDGNTQQLHQMTIEENDSQTTVQYNVGSQTVYAGEYLPFPIHFDYVSERQMGITVDEKMNLMPTKGSSSLAKQSGLGDEWWAMQRWGGQILDTLFETMPSPADVPLVFGKMMAFWTTWRLLAGKELKSVTYSVTPLWFMDAKARDFKAPEAHKMSPMVCIILE